MTVATPVPLVILTGFLGAGKTTLLNRVLAAAHHRRLAVIVNELGRIDIDGQLLKSRAGDVMELVGGCVCHEITTQEELWEGLRDVLARSRPELVVLETTGIAEPGPILEGLASLPEDERLVMPWAVVTVVDAEAGLRQLEGYAEARQQVRDADRVLLSKLDLARADVLAPLHARLHALNPVAERAGFPEGEAATLELVAWLLARGTLAQGTRAHHAHHHERQLVAASFVDESPLLAEPLLAVCQAWGPALVRVKGFVNLAGESRRGFLERAGDRTELRLQEPWRADEARRTEVVFIGEGLDPAAVRRQLWACRAPAAR